MNLLPSKRAGARACIACALMLVVGACGTTGGNAPPNALRYGVEAPLRALDAAVQGKVRAVEIGDGVSLLVSLTNMTGGQFRIVLHENGNCSSPNGFSAGPAWAPANSRKRAEDLIPALNANPESATSAEVHVSGVRVGDLTGRSVLVYAGATAAEVRPGVPNNVIACGVFSPTRLLEL